MEGITKLRKAGGSVIATIPKNIIELENFVPGQIVKITVKKVRRSFFGIAKGIGSLTKEDKRWAEGRND